MGNGMLRSANAAELLNGLSLSEAFHKYILNDTEVAALAEVVMRLDPAYESVFREGQYPGLFVKFTWPLDDSPSDLAFQLVRPFISYTDSPDPVVPDPVNQVCA